MTSAVAKVSACVNCGTPIIGAALRCPVCHDQHVKRLDKVAAAPADDQGVKPAAFWQVVFAGFVFAQVVVAVAVLLMLVGKGCS